MPDHPPSPEFSSAEWELAERYLAGEATAAELARLGARPEFGNVKAWLDALAAVNEEVETRELPRAALAEVDASWQAAQARLNLRESASRPRAPVVSARFGVGTTRATTTWLWGAAVVGMAFVVGVGLFRLRPWRASPREEYETVVGQRLSVTLEDGTAITLGPESRLQIGSDYGLRTRAVALTGEAYFAVVHDARRSFAVQVNGATVTDIGTAFDVRAYPADPWVRLVVVAGAAALRSDATSDASLLHAGDVATIANHRVVSTHRESVAALTAWMQGGLTFDETPFREVLRDVSRTFGVTITLADTTLARIPVTATFSGQPLTVVLDAVTRAVGARYEQRAQRVLIQKDSAVIQRISRVAPLLRVTDRTGVSND